jgi:ATP-dependent DNA ligase
MIDKNLKIRCGAAILNRAFPGLIPEFSVALARGYSEVPKNYVDFGTDVWYALRKYDGVRVLAFIRKGVVEFRSREGNVFVTLIRLENLINNDWAKKSPAPLDNIVLDGELCIMKDGKEDFKEAVKQVKRKSGFVSDPRYIIFDKLTIDEFESKFSPRTYGERMNDLKHFLNQFPLRGLVTSAEYIKIINNVHLDRLEQTAANREWEGLIIR